MEVVNEISMEGFKVISSDYFYIPTRMQQAALTIWDGLIGFSKQDLIMLNCCENVLLHVNIEDKKILIVPTTSKDKDALKWIRRADPLDAKKPACPRLTDKLYEAWKWDKDYNYRTIGKLVTSGTKVMLLFDFNDPEKWKRAEAKHVK